MSLRPKKSPSPRKTRRRTKSRRAPPRVLPGETSRCVGLTVAHQDMTQWCWAAVADGVSHYYHAGSKWSQCTIVNAELPETTCCTSGASASCNRQWSLDKALKRVGCLHSMTLGVLSFATVKSLLKAGRPPCARQGLSDGGGHFVAIVCVFEGEREVSPGAGTLIQRLKISDPYYGDVVVDYSTFVAGYQSIGTWTRSYRTKP